MNRDLERIAIVAARECIRQDVDEYALIRLLDAHWYAWRHRDTTPTEADIKELAFKIEPEKANGYRQNPVSFANLTTATDWKDIPHAMRTLCHVMPAPGTWADTANDVTKALLTIHPFRDGNGRVAWVLLNWLQDSLAQPTELPDYFEATA